MSIACLYTTGDVLDRTTWKSDIHSHCGDTDQMTGKAGEKEKGRCSHRDHPEVETDGYVPVSFQLHFQGLLLLSVLLCYVVTGSPSTFIILFILVLSFLLLPLYRDEAGQLSFRSTADYVNFSSGSLLLAFSLSPLFFLLCLS